MLEHRHLNENLISSTMGIKNMKIKIEDKVKVYFTFRIRILLQILVEVTVLITALAHAKSNESRKKNGWIKDYFYLFHAYYTFLFFFTDNK